MILRQIGLNLLKIRSKSRESLANLPDLLQL